jgi:multiple sugar transport system permease protein
LAVWVLHNYFVSIPTSIEEAGLTDGAGRLQVFWHLMLPLAIPGIISISLITFLFGWAQFLFPLVLSTDRSTQPLTVLIAALQGRHIVPSTLMSAAGMLAIAVPAAIALAFNRYIVNGLLAGSTK